ncbi:hypothetical protein L873DRAFT_905033 [Choiromyces venosus 120613-1]|uniref:Uncharacterized protein n=1 Tax=Choiromyces venosus 120613-1 TaxID=1336337 RepID=A0A3N4K0K0_9PEZI|nr:hypothetical protein L873DRAFT_905033 [Choiromyces venosus 120613-1]
MRQSRGSNRTEHTVAQRAEHRPSSLYLRGPEAKPPSIHPSNSIQFHPSIHRSIDPPASLNQANSTENSRFPPVYSPHIEKKTPLPASIPEIPGSKHRVNSSTRKYPPPHPLQHTISSSSVQNRE